MFSRFCRAMIIAVTFILFSGHCFAQGNWDFNVSMIKHQVEIKTGSSIGLYDGKTFSTTAPVLKNGRIFIPLRLLKDAKLAQISWQAKEKYADVTVPEESIHIRYRVGQSEVSFVNGERVDFYRIEIPAPFIKQGILYIPMQSFERTLGKNISYANQTLTISWSIPAIEKNSLPEKTGEEVLPLTVLYEKGLDAPLMMGSAGIGAYGSLNNGEQKEVLFDGKKFIQMKVTLPLKPGDNPFYLWVRKGNLNLEEPFVIKREVAEGSLVPMGYEDQVSGDMNVRDVFEITEPAGGYLQLAVPGKVNLKGQLKEESFGDNIFSLVIGKLDGGKYREVERMALPVVQGEFSAAIDFPDSGSYVVEVISPKYIPTTEQGTAGTKWAEIRVEVGCPPVKRGNTTGNINNNGLYTADGDWIYFSNLADSEKLYKMKADGTGIAKISDDSGAWYLNTDGDHIFYSGDGWKLTGIKNDGSGKTVLDTDSYHCNVVNGWIYYIRGYMQNGLIYKMKTDGTSKTRLSQDPVSQIVVTDDAIYYSSFYSKIIKIGLDGSGKTKLLDGGNVAELNMVDDWFYFNYNKSLYKMKTDGSQMSKICGDDARDVNVSGGWIYYSDDAEYWKKLYRIRLDGTGKEKLSDDKPGYIHVINNQIYYINLYTNTVKEMDISFQ